MHKRPGSKAPGMAVNSRNACADDLTRENVQAQRDDTSAQGAG